MSHDFVEPVTSTKLQRNCSIHVKFTGREGTCFVKDLAHSSFNFTHIYTQTNTVVGSTFATSDPVITLNFSNNYTHKSSYLSWLSNLHSPASTPPFSGM